ncbi:MAG: ABC transporter permease [Candidatus Krumholzibacteriia bacterium]
MARYALRRLAGAAPLFVLITAICFFLIHLVPGGPLAALELRHRGEDIERLRLALGLDRPVIVQYFMWLSRFLRGDLGDSLMTGEPVSRMILERLPATLELMGTALVLSLAVGIAVGIVSAVRRGTWIDHTLGALSLIGLSVPVFWLGVVCLLVFSAHLGWLPASGRGPVGEAFSLLERLRHLVLPASVLAAVQVPLWSRYMRGSLLDVLGEDHVRTAHAKGLPRRQVVLRHAVRPALNPVITLLGLQVPALFTGAVITEKVFAWPGIGRLFYDTVRRFDYTGLMGILAIAAALIILGNLAADLTNARLDPRIRLGGRR